MRTCMHAIKNWTLIWMDRLLLQSHNLLSKSIMLPAILTMEKEKGAGKGKEVEVVVLTEVAIMIIMGVVDNMMQARDLLDMAKGARIMVTMGTKVITTLETRISTSHLTSSLNLFTRISNHGNSNKDLVSSFKGIRTGVADTVEVATMVGVPEAVATGVSACLITSMGRATGRLNAPHNLCVRSAVAHT